MASTSEKPKIANPKSWSVNKFNLFRSMDNQQLVLLCFCGEPLVQRKLDYICAKDTCGFTINVNSFTFMYDNDIFAVDANKKIIAEHAVPFCKECHSINLFINTNQPSWQSYMKPGYKCACDQNKRLYVNYYDSPLLSSNFNLDALSEFQQIDDEPEDDNEVSDKTAMRKTKGGRVAKKSIKGKVAVVSKKATKKILPAGFE